MRPFEQKAPTDAEVNALPDTAIQSIFEASLT
jgi:hypothetical protein